MMRWIFAFCLGCGIAAGCTAVSTPPPDSPPGPPGGGGSVVTDEKECLPVRDFVSPEARLGRSIREMKIVGGKPSSPEDLPGAAALVDGSWQYCGGTIISPRWAMTAAHCQPQVGEQVLVGATNLGEARRIFIIESRINAGWTSRTMRDDVAVVRLAEAAEVPTVPLAETLPPAGTLVTVLGWGRTQEGGSSSKDLLKVEIPLLSTLECVATYPTQIYSTMLCAGTAGKDSCQGDSGGPLVFHGEQIGIVSWGRGCARPDAPGVYTSVPIVRDWVKRCAPEEPGVVKAPPPSYGRKVVEQ